MTFRLLSDREGHLIRRVGILNAEVPPDDPVYGIPYPGCYLVDEQGIVFEKRFHPDFHVREPMGSLLLYFQLKEYSEKLEQKVQERTMQLIETARLATLGKLIAAINHELNTPLGALANGMDLLWKYLEGACSQLDPRRRQALEEVRRAVEAAYERINQVMGDLRQFIRLEQAEMQPVDLRQSLEAALELLSSRLDGRIRIQREYGEIPAVRAYAPQINQALWELLSNAVEAIDGQGDITIATRGDRGGVEVTIRDTGRGIPAAELEQILEPRLRPKHGRMGVSLGLTLVHKIVNDHGGRLRISSREGQGTTVTVRLPMQPATA